MPEIRLHSRVGLITNSSTELFVIKKPVKNIKEVLLGLVELHNKIHNTSEDDEAYETYETIFESLQIYTKEKYEEDLEYVDRVYKRHLDYTSKNGIQPKTKNEYFEDRYYLQENIGATMLYSAECNSIPYWMWEAIESLGVKVERYHLG